MTRSKKTWSRAEGLAGRARSKGCGFVGMSRAGGMLGAGALSVAVATASTVAAPLVDSIDGLQLWLDASDAESLTIDPDSGQVMEWQDRRGTGIYAAPDSATMGNSNLPPSFVESGVNGNPALRFGQDTVQGMQFGSELRLKGDGANDITSGVEGMTGFVVARLDGQHPGVETSAASLVRAQSRTSARYFHYRVNTDSEDEGRSRMRLGGQRVDEDGFARTDAEVDSLVEGATHIHGVTIDYVGNTVVLTQDGRVTSERVDKWSAEEFEGITSNTATLYTSIGAGSGGQLWNGDIAEILLFDRVLEDEEFMAVGEYLGDKYGVTFIPEPASIAMLAAGSIVLLRRRHNRARD